MDSFGKHLWLLVEGQSIWAAEYKQLTDLNESKS